MTARRLDTLVDDIYIMLNRIEQGEEHEIPEEVFDELGANIADCVRRQMKPRKPKAGTDAYASQIGRPLRMLWLEREGVQGEPLLPHTKIKFMYGDIVEALVLFLARAAGHTVENEQEQVEVTDGDVSIRGRKDADIDSETVDIKSASSYGYRKFRDGTLHLDDAFGYLAQLGCYKSNDPAKPLGGFLAVDKGAGHLCLYRPPVQHVPDKKELLAKARVLKNLAEMPEQCYPLVPVGKSGNMGLHVGCSYCKFKKHCFPGLRTFLYSNKPVHLVVVKKEPNVPELGVTDE